MTGQGDPLIIRTAFSHYIPIPLTRGASGHAAGKPSADSRFFYRHHRPNSLAAFVFGLLFIVRLKFQKRSELKFVSRTIPHSGGYNTLRLALGFIPVIFAALLVVAPSGAAEPVVLTDAALAGVTGQAGISISTDMSLLATASVWKFSDTDSTPLHWLEFRNITVDDGSGGPFLVTTYQDGTLASSDPITIDIGTNSSGYTLVSYYDSTQVSPRWISVGDLVFCDQSLGSLNLDALSVGPSLLRYGAHADGTGGGFNFDYTTSITAQALRYTYSTTAPGTLTLSGIHLAYQADVLGKNGTGDNPADPTTWAFTGANNVFHIGDIDGGNPAKVDVVTETTGVTSLFLTLPMQGTLRVEDVNFGGNDFGPIAIDGIQVHRLLVKISP